MRGKGRERAGEKGWCAGDRRAGYSCGGKRVTEVCVCGVERQLSHDEQRQGRRASFYGGEKRGGGPSRAGASSVVKEGSVGGAGRRGGTRAAERGREGGESTRS